MATYAGDYLGDGPIAHYYASARLTGVAGFLDGLFAGVSIQEFRVYRNLGWYADGSTWESWTTLRRPSTSPPSGHTLTLLQHYPMDRIITLRSSG